MYIFLYTTNLDLQECMPVAVVAYCNFDYPQARSGCYPFKQLK